MAEVMVFVDDAVRGTLPAICVKDGVPTGDMLAMRQEIGDRAGLGVAWLLLLAGPLGWLGLLVVSASRGGRGEVLTVRLPMSEPAYQRGRAAQRLRRMAGLVTVVSSAAAIMLLASDSGSFTALWLVLIGAVAVAAVITMIVADRRVHDAAVGIDLDASRRWVIFTRVHPAFATAYQAQPHHQRT